MTYAGKPSKPWQPPQMERIKHKSLTHIHKSNTNECYNSESSIFITFSCPQIKLKNAKSITFSNPISTLGVFFFLKKKKKKTKSITHSHRNTTLGRRLATMASLHRNQRCWCSMPTYDVVTHARTSERDREEWKLGFSKYITVAFSK